MMLLMILLMVMMLLMILIQAGSSIKPQIPSESNIHDGFERDPAILYTGSMCPSRAFTNGVLSSLFFRQIFGFCIFGIFGS